MKFIIKSLLRLNRAGIITALFLIPFIFTFANAGNNGLWVIREFATSKENIDEVISFCSKNNIDEIYFQIRGRGDAFYESRFIKRSEKITNKEFDPLSYICKKASLKNIKINAWFNTYILYSNSKVDPGISHIFNLFPEWTSTDRYGINDANINFNKLKNKIFEGSYLSPIHPKVNQYLFILIREIIDNYTIDGIHLDYVRFQNRDYGFNPAGRNIFKKETGLNPELYMDKYKNLSKKIPDPIFFELYDAYRTEAVNSLIKKIKKYASAQLVPIKLSAAVKASPQIAKERYFQDWSRWLKEEWIDYVVIMNYNNYNNYISNIDNIYNTINEKYHNRIYCGVGIWKLSPSESQREIAYSRKMGFENIVYFSYTTFINKPTYNRIIK